MAKIVKITEMVVERQEHKDPIYVATGTCDDKPFVAKTIIWKGEPIFKLDNGRLAGSNWGRGERISVARACKHHRLEKFGNSMKEIIKPELKTGEIVRFGPASSGGKPKSELENYLRCRRSGMR